MIEGLLWIYGIGAFVTFFILCTPGFEPWDDTEYPMRLVAAAAFFWPIALVGYLILGSVSLAREFKRALTDK